MKPKITLLLFLISLLVNANTSPELEKEIFINFNNEFKIENTYSCNINKNSSIHLILGKSKLKAYKADENLIIQSVKAFSIPKKAIVIGQHINGNIISLTISFTKKNKKFIKIYDINFNENSVTASKQYKNDNQIIITSTNDRTFILYSDKYSFSSREVISSKESNFSTIKFEDYPQYYKLFKKNYHYKFINQKQYIPTGPFSFSHTYIDDDNQFIFILDYKRKFKFGKINPKKLNEISIFELAEYPKKVEGHGVQFNSKYFYNNQVYFYYGSAQSSELKIINVDTHQITKNITLFPENEFVKKEGGSNNYTFKKYLRKVQTGTKEACLTVNELYENGDVSVRFDYVREENDLYYYPWMQYDHNTRGFIPGGGPSPYIRHNSSPIKNILPLSFQEKTYHHITLDQNFKFTTPKHLKFKKLKMNKLHYIETIKKGYLKHSSNTFLNYRCRYFSFDNKTKKIVLKVFI